MTDPILIRESTETLLDYMLRLGRNRDVYGLDWSEVSDLLNKDQDTEYTESKWRKEIQAYMRVYDHLVAKNVGQDELQDELHKIQEERIKLQTIRIDYNKDKREKSRKDLLFEQLRDGFERLPSPDFNVNLVEKYKLSNRKAVLSFGDIHFGKEFKSINNEYSEEIAKQRMEKLISEVVPILEKEGLTNLEIINGADSIEGMSLRVSQLQSLSIGFVDQTIKFSKFMSSWLNKFSEFANITYRHVPSANHSEIRPHNSKRGEFPAEDLERIIMHYIHDVLENNQRVDVVVDDKGIIDFNILNYNAVALHGHQLRNKKDVIKDLSMLHRKFYDYCFIYHYHHGNNLTVGQGETNNVEIIQSPSIMGSDEYSDSLMTGAKPGAILCVFEEGKGKTIQYNINLQ